MKPNDAALDEFSEGRLLLEFAHSVIENYASSWNGYYFNAGGNDTRMMTWRPVSLLNRSCSFLMRRKGSYVVPRYTSAAWSYFMTSNPPSMAKRSHRSINATSAEPPIAAFWLLLHWPEHLPHEIAALPSSEDARLAESIAHHPEKQDPLRKEHQARDGCRIARWREVS